MTGHYDSLLADYEALRRAVARFLAYSPHAHDDDAKPLWDLAGNYTDADLQPSPPPDTD